MRTTTALALAALTASSAVTVPALAQPITLPPAMAPPPPPEAAPPPASAPASASAPAVTRSTVALWAAGIAVVGAGVGATFGILALQNKSDYQKNPTFSNTDNGNNDAAYADGAFALAVAAGVTSLVLFLTRDTTHDVDPSAAAPPSRPTVSACPIVTPHGGGAGAVLRF
jgi:hypothetical protein